MKILIASGAFKDVFSPIEACNMIGDVIESLNCNKISYEKLPMVDGGEHSADVLEYLLDCKKIFVNNILNPYGLKTQSFFLELDKVTAYIDSSVILRLLPDEDYYKNPLNLTSYGLGQIINKVIKLGYKNIYLGLGGTNTVDCGIGMAQALGVIFFGKNNNKLCPKNKIYFSGEDLLDIDRVEVVNNYSAQNKIITLCDGTANIRSIRTPIKQKIGKNHFDSYKSIVEKLELGIKKYSSVIERALHQESRPRFLPIHEQKHFGVAGGINLSLCLIFNLEPKLGYDFFIKKFGLAEKIKKADIVITGEGRLDNSLNGKAPVGVCNVAKIYKKPTLYLTGDVNDSLKKYCSENLSLNIPKKYKDNGISAISSCHNYYNNVEIPLDELERNAIFRKNTSAIFKSSIRAYLEYVFFKKIN
jgi:glycerate 2-kinase